MRSSGRLALALAALVVALTALPLGGHARADDACRVECDEARSVCHRAARAAHRACDALCDERIERAAERARQICDDRELEPRECLELVLRAAREARESCGAPCRTLRKEARARCEAERRECRAACLEPLDGACVATCVDELDRCTDELDLCTNACELRAEEALERCTQHVEQPLVFRACVKRVRREARLCTHACHQERPCAADFRGCLHECRIEE